MNLSSEEHKNTVIEEITKILENIKNGSIIAVPRKRYDYCSSFNQVSFEKIISTTGFYTLEIEIYDDSLKGK